MVNNVITGVFPAIVTPMQRDGNRRRHEINYDVLPRYLEFLVQALAPGNSIKALPKQIYPHEAGYYNRKSRET